MVEPDGARRSPQSERRKRHWLEWVAMGIAVLFLVYMLVIMAILSWWVISDGGGGLGVWVSPIAPT